MTSPSEPLPDAVDLVNELEGTVCPCGGPKASRNTFCRTCYFTLPYDMRQALYRRIGEGYQEAYAAAIAHLKENG